METMKVFGTSVPKEIGSAIAHRGKIHGHIVREATEAEWFESHPVWKAEYDKYPDSPSLFTFPYYYIYE